jgi:23S rRNA (uracil1939-C5)-methyltransferase
MSLEKNQEYEIKIEDMGNEGEGIGHINGMAVFVKDTVPGDVAKIKIVKAKKSYAYGRLMELITPSGYRVEPVCPLARKCGGCSIMHVSYHQQLRWKQKKVADCLTRIGGIANVEEVMEPIIGMVDDETGELNLETSEQCGTNRSDLGMSVEHGTEFPATRYRNKAQFPVRRDKEGRIAIGFYAGRTHSVIDTDVCYLQAEVNDEIIKRCRHFFETYGVEPYDEENHIGLVRHILTRVGHKTGEVMVCLILNGNELIGENAPTAQGTSAKCKNVEQEFARCLQSIPGITSISININQEKTNRILGQRCRTIWGKDYITDYIGNVKYQISPLSFYQVNPKQTEKLYGKALEYADLHGEEMVWDLYCGIGTISLFLAQQAKKVCGVELVPQAIEDARNNAAINGFTNVEFFVGKAEEVLPEQYEKTGEYADVIVVDPPRKGCDEVALRTMIRMAPQRIVYVSCDPATLARDVKVLVAAGYELKKVCAVDQFGHSGHVETVILLSQQKPDDRIEVGIELDELDLTSAESKATYAEIKDYVLKEHGLKVSNLYISQVKRKCGIEVGVNYNLPKSKDSRQPQCPEEKEKAIKDALEHFRMV